jgi:glyoxylase-like metal-dependent hydrolase (beta-lactamase superfamily II)
MDAKKMEILPGVYQINGLISSCYLVTSGHGMILVDTGMPADAKKIVKCVKDAGKQLTDIKYIFITHADFDHAGSAMRLQKLTGAKIVMHEAELALARKGRGKHATGFAAIILGILTPFVRFQPVVPDIVIREDEEIAGFQMLHTPGHTKGSISIYQPGKVIFAGDAFWSDSHGNPIPPVKALSFDITQARSSAVRIAALDFDVLLLGHGASVKSDAKAKVQKLLETWK